MGFMLQTATGHIIAQWPLVNGAYPADAHEAAMGALLGLELAALGWFVTVTAFRPKPRQYGVLHLINAFTSMHPILAGAREQPFIWQPRAKLPPWGQHQWSDRT
jgi:hypothetical protein